MEKGVPLKFYQRTYDEDVKVDDKNAGEDEDSDAAASYGDEDGSGSDKEEAKTTT
jgi:hypothetical protein